MNTPPEGPLAPLTAGEVEADREMELIRFKGEDTGLRGRNYQVLLLLMERAPALVTKEEILDTVWRDVPVTEGVLTTAMKAIRQALSDPAKHPRYIETRYGRGYRFLPSVSQGAVLSDGVPANELARPVDAEPDTPSRNGLGLWPAGLVAGLALILLAAVLVWTGRSQTADTRIELVADSELAELAQMVQRELLAVGLLDRNTGADPMRLDIHHIVDGDNRIAELILSDRETGDLIDIRALPLDTITPRNLARRIAIENSNILRCADSLVRTADGMGVATDPLYPNFIRLCRASFFPDAVHDPAAASQRILEQIPDSPFAMALNALVLLNRPRQFLAGRPNEELERIRAEAVLMAEAAYLADPETEITRLVRGLARLDDLPLAHKLEALEQISSDDWISFHAALHRAVFLRQAGRLTESAFLLSQIEAQWPHSQPVVVASMLTRLPTTSWPEVRDAAHAHLDLYPDSPGLASLTGILTRLYGSNTERAALTTAPGPAGAPELADCFDLPQSAPLSAGQIEALIASCSRLDATYAARQLARAGETGRALDILEQLDPSSRGLAIIFYYSEFEAVRETDRFAAIAEAFGLVDLWRTIGIAPDFCQQQASAAICRLLAG